MCHQRKCCFDFNILGQQAFQSPENDFFQYTAFPLYISFNVNCMQLSTNFMTWKSAFNLKIMSVFQVVYKVTLYHLMGKNKLLQRIQVANYAYLYKLYAFGLKGYILYADVEVLKHNFLLLQLYVPTLTYTCRQVALTDISMILFSFYRDIQMNGFCL